MAQRPVTQLDKSEVLTGLFAVWESIDALLDGLPEPRWHAMTPLPGWDVKAVVAHMIGTESFLAGAPAPQPDIDVSALDHVRNDVGVMNECWVRHLSGESGAAILERFRMVTDDRRKALTDMSDDAWHAVSPTPTGPDSYGRFMRIRVFDCWIHEHDIRDAIGRPATEADLRGPAPQLALDEIAASMGFVVGKLGKAPDGSRIALELTGPLARTIRVVVEGRGQVVNDFGGQEPTSTIRLDGLLFTRLASGRVRNAPAEAVELGGDADVAARIVEHLNFTI